MSVSGDFAVPMSFSRERDLGTGTKNNIFTDWQLLVMRIQINKTFYDSLTTTQQMCWLTELINKNNSEMFASAIA